MLVDHAQAIAARCSVTASPAIKTLPTEENYKLVCTLTNLLNYVCVCMCAYVLYVYLDESREARQYRRR